MEEHKEKHNIYVTSSVAEGDALNSNENLGRVYKSSTGSAKKTTVKDDPIVEELIRFNKTNIGFTWSLPLLTDINGKRTTYRNFGTVYEDKTIIDPQAIVIWRTYSANGDNNEGGRFVSALTNQIHREHRKELLIDGQPVVELDYKSIQPRCAYANEGLDAPADLYDLGDGRFSRSLRKAVLLIMLNGDKVKSHGSFHGAVLKNIEKEYDKKVRKYQFDVAKNPNTPKVSPLVRPSKKETTECRQLFLNKHAPISSYFASNSGAQLQYMESELARRIMKAFADKGQPLFVVADNFITTTTNRDFLEESMREAFFDTFAMELPADAISAI